MTEVQVANSLAGLKVAKFFLESCLITDFYCYTTILQNKRLLQNIGVSMLTRQEFVSSPSILFSFLVICLYIILLLFCFVMWFNTIQFSNTEEIYNTVFLPPRLIKSI